MGGSCDKRIAEEPTVPACGDVRSPQAFSDAELHRRAALRVALHIRGLWEEKGSSDSRLLEALLLPDRFTLSGRSHAAQGAGCREHVVPRKVVVDECHRMLARGNSDDDIAAFIQDHVRIVVISNEERILLDRHLGLRQRMPDGWRPGDDIYARLRRAGISWSPVEGAFDAAR